MNVTPLVDVMLVLLIIFMVTAPMLAAGLHVDLPQARAARTLKPEKPVVLTVTRDGTVGLGQQELALEQVMEALNAQIGGDLTRPIHLQADKSASYGVVVALMDLLASHGLTRIAVLTTPAARPQAPAPTSSAPPAAQAP